MTVDALAVSPPVHEGASWLERWSPLGGLLFVLGAVALAFTPAGDETGDTAAEVAGFAERADEWLVVTMLFALLSLLLLGWFVAGLVVRLRALGAAAEGALALAGGLVLTLLFFLALSIWTAPIVDTEGDRAAAVAQAETYLAIDDLGWVSLGGAGVGAGLMAIATSLAVLRLRLLPAWAGWLGVALGVGALATVAFIGLFAWLGWIVLASVVMLRRNPGLTRR